MEETKIADRFFEEHIEKELDVARDNQQIQLQQIIKEGFVNSGNVIGNLNVYEKDNRRIFYDSYNDRVRAEFDIRDLMTKM